MLKRRAVGLVVLLVFLLIPTAYALTIDGPLNLIGPHGGIVRYANPTVIQQIQVANTLYRFTNLRYGSHSETISFDSATGQIMTIQAITVNQLIYNVTGAQLTYIIRPGYGPPDNVNGGTYVYNAGTELTTITPTGAGVVTVTWQEERTNLYNDLLVYIRVAAIIPMLVGVMYLFAIWQGAEFDPKIAGIIISVTIAMLLIAVVFNGYT